MKKRIDNEPEPWRGLRESLCRLIETERSNNMKKKKKKQLKSIEEICEMDTIPAWRTTLDQLPDGKIPDMNYDALVGIINSPYIMADDDSEAMEMLMMAYEHFKKRYYENIGDSNQNATLTWLAEATYCMIVNGTYGEEDDDLC